MAIDKVAIQAEIDEYRFMDEIVSVGAMTNDERTTRQIKIRDNIKALLAV